MRLEKVKKLRKGLVVAVIAGVVTVQTIPVINAGMDAQAETTADAEAASDDMTDAEEADSDQSQTEESRDKNTETADSDNTDSNGGNTSAGDNGESGNQNTPDDGQQTADNGASGETGDSGENAGKTGADKDADSADTKDASDENRGEQTPADEADAAKGTDEASETAGETTAVTEEPAAAEEEAVEPAEEAQPVAEPENPAAFAQDTTWYPVPGGELVPSPVIYRGFRFWTVAKDYAFAASDINVLEDKSEKARVVGKLSENAVCYVLKTEDDWAYVESGDVRGFVKTDQILYGEEAQPILSAYETQAAFLSNVSGEDESVDTVAPVAEPVVPKDKNEAFDYYRATVYQTVVEKDYALPVDDLINVRETPSAGGRVVGVLPADGICYVIADRDSSWIYVESGDVRGFVRSDKLILADTPGDAGILTKDEEDYSTATASVEPEENQALYYTMTSIRSGVPDGMERSSILQYAAEFIGNPYVWGGTSLTNGADCSGFVQSIYAQYGYTLPRTAAEQSQVGTQIPVEDAQPGDLIFYGNGGSIYHVVIYAGDGKTIEAKSTKAGIVASEVSYQSAVWAVRVIDEQEAVRYEIPDGLGSVHTYMGWQKVTMRGSQQYAFRESAGMAFDPEGFAVVDNRYVIACTTTFGNIGDYVDFYQADGTVIPCIIGDFKNQNDAGCNAYGHMNGHCIVEFVVDQNSWYRSGHANPGTDSCHPEWNQPIVRAENVGSYYD